MKPKLFIVCIIISLSWLTPHNELSATDTGKGDITGTVFDKGTNEPLPGVNVIIDGTKYGSATDKHGIFLIKDVPAGVYKLKISMIGYSRVTLEKVLVIPDSVTKYVVYLNEEAVSGEEVVIIADPAKGKEGKGKSKKEAIDTREDDLKEILDKALYGGTVDGAGKDKSDEDKGSKTKEFGESKKDKSKQTTASGLKAGFADDNKQFSYFVNFLDQYGSTVKHIPAGIQERIVIKVNDLNGKPVPNAAVTVKEDDDELTTGNTYADGSFMFFPSMFKNSMNEFEAEISFNKLKQRIQFQRDGKREIDVQFNYQRSVPANVPLDIVFVLDATGSMGEEIRKLKNSIELISLNISALSTKPAVRFGLVAYRDRGEEYVTRKIDLTDNLDLFQKHLDQIDAVGGGDDPEDLQAALRDAIQGMSWNKNGLRICFIITDASPHFYKNQTYTYMSAILEAKQKAIKIFSLGCGGLDLQGELILRQIAQLTGGKYIFMTYGEKGESEGGKTGSVSHHTGSNYETDKLEALVIRFIKEELQYLSDQKIEVADEYFEAIRNEDEPSSETVNKLMAMALTQLIDYSSWRLEDQTTIAVMSLNSIDSTLNLKSDLDYLTEHLLMSVSRNKKFQLVERQQIEKVLKEQDLQLTDLVDETTCVKVGLLAGAKTMLMGTLFEKEKQYEVFLKMVKIETAEVLSVTKLKIDKKLGVIAKK